MDEAEFEALAQRSLTAVEQKLAVIHERHGLARAARWTWEGPKQEAAPFRIYDAEDNVLFECIGLEVGTFSPSTSSWRWAWANSSLPDSDRERMRPLRELAATTGRAAFDSEDAFGTDLDSAWTIAAIAAEHLGAAGLYDAATRNTAGEVLHAYLAYMNVPDPAITSVSAVPAAPAGPTERRDDDRPPTPVPDAGFLPPVPPDRPRGLISFNIPMSAAEVAFFKRCLQTLDRDPPFEEIDGDIRRAFGATPERPLGELEPLSHREQRAAASFRFRGKDGDPGDVCDITSLNIDIAALAMLIAVAVPSAQPGGFTYTPMGPVLDPDDPRLLPLPAGGSVRITLSTILITDTDVPPAHELRQWKFYVP